MSSTAALASREAPVRARRPRRCGPSGLVGVRICAVVGLGAMVPAALGGYLFVMSRFRGGGNSAQMGGGFIAAYALSFLMLYFSKQATILLAAPHRPSTRLSGWRPRQPLPRSRRPARIARVCRARLDDARGQRGSG